MRSKVITVIAALLVVPLLGPGPAKAEPAPPPQPTTLAAPLALVPSRPSPEQVGAALAAIARASDGRVRLGAIGRSNEGRPLRLASVGRGPTRLLYVTQQHGDEPLGTPAALQALWVLGVPDTAWHRWLRSRLTIDIVVQANPDGAVRDQRYNHDPSATGEYTEPGVGYDINRFHNPFVSDTPVPESRAVLAHWRSVRPSIVVDYHMQGRYLQPDGRETNASILWPTTPLASAAAVTRGRQLAVRNYQVLAGANVTRYPGGDYEGIARNAYGARVDLAVVVPGFAPSCTVSGGTTTARSSRPGGFRARRERRCGTRPAVGRRGP